MFELNEEALASIKKVVAQPTLYPEFPRKSKEQRYDDLVWWYESYGEVNEIYNFYGLDRIDAPRLDAYLDRGVFRKQRYAENSSYLPDGSAFPYNYTAVMRDKALFEAFCSWALGEEPGCLRSLGIVDSRGFVSKRGDSQTFLDEHEGERLIFKQAYGCSGAGVVLAEIREGKVFSSGAEYEWDAFIASLDANAKKIWLVQPYIVQHETLSSFNETSVNTLRILTFNTGDRVIPLGRCILRIGKPGAFVDNCDGGGSEVEISAEGLVGEWVLDYNRGVKRRCEHGGSAIPFYEEALRLAERLHSFIPQIFSVGWDICITPEGPVAIEGNDGWDPYSIQAPLGGELREFWDAALLERHEYFKR